MAQEGLKIIIDADVNRAINNIGKFNTKLGDTDQIVADVVGSSENLEDALDKLSKQGLVSINSLQLSINDFKKGFADATDPADIKKFGDALKVLQARQADLISSGLGVADSHKKIGEHISANVQPTQRLSSSLLGLTKIFDLLPEEVSHLTHNFEGFVQSFERIGHGSESTADKVTKFASVLGQVGLGLAISVVTGLLVNFIAELAHSDEALEKATEEGIRFEQEISRINKSIDEAKSNLKFIAELGDLNIDINFGKGFEGDLLKLQEGFTDLQGETLVLEKKLEEARTIANEAFKSFQDGISDDARSITGAFNLVSQVPDKLLKNLSETDKTLIENAKKTQEEVFKVQELITENERQQSLQAARIRALRADKEREDQKKANDDLQKLLESRNNILEEFRIKFGAIKLPLPLLDSEIKAIPLGKLNDKLLREFLNGTLNVFEKAIKDSKEGKLDLLIPVDIHPKPEVVGVSDLVRQIQDKFGDISKAVEDAVNKGIFDVPIDFKLAPEGDGKALEQFEKNLNDLIKGFESISGQKNAIFEISPDFDVNKIDPAFVKSALDRAQHEIQVIASGVPIKFGINAKGEVTVEVDKDKVADDLAKAVNDAIQQGATDIFTGFGDLIGDAISKGFDSDGAKEILSAIAGIIANVGKALIKAGVALLGLQKVIDSLATNPALAIAVGVALVALSRIFQNQIAGAREHGGQVGKGMSYLVNERGREIFAPADGSAPRWIEGGAQIFKPEVSGKVFSAQQSKLLAAKLNLPAFENGGLVRGPVFGLVGEGAGISSLNPEVIAPLETLKSLLPLNKNSSIDVNIRGSLSNRTIRLGQAREGRSNRRTG